MSIQNQSEVSQQETMPGQAEVSHEVCMRNQLKNIESWIAQCSRHLVNLEQRAMWGEVLGYEMLRHFMRHLSGFCPPPRGDWGWFLRKAEDLSTRGVRQLMRYYLSAGEDVEAFLARAMNLVRLYLEEALHRVLLHEMATLRRKALGNLMVTMRGLEGAMMGARQRTIGIFFRFTEDNVRAMLSTIAAGGQTDLSICPSFEAVMSTEMRLEVISLMHVTAVPSLVTMTNEEVRALIAYHGKQLQEDEVRTGPARVIN